MRQAEKDHYGAVAAAEMAKNWPFVALTFGGMGAALFLMIYGAVRLVGG